MKFLIALAFLAVVSALPPRDWFGHRQPENYQVDGWSSYQNKHQHFNLIKLAYDQLIEKLNHPPQDENEEEERAINDIVDTINIIGQIIHHRSDDSNVNNEYYRPSNVQHPEHNGQDGDVPNVSSDSENVVSPILQDEEEKVSSEGEIENEVISLVDELPVDDESESDEVSLVDSALEDDESEHDILSLVNQKDDAVNRPIALNSKNVANELAAL